MLRKRLTVAGLTSALLFSPAAYHHAASQGSLAGATASVATPATVGQFVEQTADALQSLVGRAEAAGDFLTARIGHEILLLLDAFEKANARLLDQALGGIGLERRAFLDGIQKAVADLNAPVHRTVVQAQDIVDQLYQLGHDVTFQDVPVIFRYRGTVVVPGAEQDVRIVITGANLDSPGEPILVYEGQPYPARRMDNQRLLVEIPRSAFTHEERDIRSVSADLHLFRETGGMIGIGRRTERLVYNINFVLLPERLADVSVTYRTPPGEQRHTRVIRQEVNHNSSSRNWDCRSFAYSPAAPDRRFDPDKSSVKPGSGNSRGQLRDVTIRSTGVSFRICAKRRWTDRDNGFRHAKVHIVETWTTTTEGEMTTSTPRQVEWMREEPVQVGPGIREALVNVRLFTGYNMVAVRGRQSEYLEIDFDEDKGVVVLIPKIPEDLRQL